MSEVETKISFEMKLVLFTFSFYLSMYAICFVLNDKKIFGIISMIVPIVVGILVIKYFIE